MENPAQEKLALLSQLYQRLVQIHEQGRKAVVLIDEAQMLETRELMEEFRGLLNLEVPERKLISFVFFGLAGDRAEPPAGPAAGPAGGDALPARAAERREHPLLHRAPHPAPPGATGVPFTPAAIEVLHRLSGGSPRIINTLCDNALFEAYLAQETTVDAPRIEEIARNLALGPAEADARQRRAGPGRPAGNVDLSEVDRYLESLKS